MGNHREHADFHWNDLYKADAKLASEILAKANEYQFPASCLQSAPPKGTLQEDEVLTVGIPGAETKDDVLWVWKKDVAREMFDDRDLFTDMAKAIEAVEMISKPLA